MSKFLINRDIDWIVVLFLITEGRPSEDRRLNRYLLTFKNLNGFSKYLIKRYHFLQRQYLKMPSLEDNLLPRSNTSFWNKTLESFYSGESPIIFDGNHKGSTRKKLYKIGMIFGYFHVINGQETYEVRSRRTGIIYATNQLENRLYTRIELSRKKVNYPNEWIPADKDSDGRILYKRAENASDYKRGIMKNSPGVLTFFKV